jgi:hypothetical protein
MIIQFQPKLEWKDKYYMKIFTAVPCVLTYPVFLLLQPMHNKFALKHYNLH